VVEHYRLSRPVPGDDSPADAPVPPIMVEFAQQLLTAHPAEAARAFVPIVALFGEVCDGAIEAGAVRADIRDGPLTGIVLEAIMFNAFSSTIAAAWHRPESEDPAEELWNLLMHGIGTGEPT
jgi:hypothetical protein